MPIILICQRLIVFFPPSYANFINVLINHPSLMSDFKRLEYFADIHQSKRHRTRPNDSHFHKVIKSLTFIDSKDWDTKIVEDGYLDEAKRHRETNKKKTYRWDDIEDLIKLIRNVYVHHTQDGNFTGINKEINESFPGLLSHLRAILRMKNVEDFVWNACITFEVYYSLELRTPTLWWSIFLRAMKFNFIVCWTKCCFNGLFIVPVILCVHLALSFSYHTFRLWHIKTCSLMNVLHLQSVCLSTFEVRVSIPLVIFCRILHPLWGTRS